MTRQISEERTRKEMIDTSTGSAHRPQLESAGWHLRDHAKVKIEILVDGYDAGTLKIAGISVIIGMDMNHETSVFNPVFGWLAPAGMDGVRVPSHYPNTGIATGRCSTHVDSATSTSTNDHACFFC